MLEYLFKGEVGGLEIRLMRSTHAVVSIFGHFRAHEILRAVGILA